MDFVVQAARLPAPGETVLGRDFRMIPGGKGANQACAVGRLARACRARMVGRVGEDPFAGQLTASLAAAGVDVAHVYATPGQATGIAQIWVESGGQNSIVVAPGANGALTATDVHRARPAFDGARCALFQLESPLEAVAAGLRAARAAGAVTILDPAPAQPLTAALLSDADILTPNESEACVLLGRPPARLTLDDAGPAARALQALGPRIIVLKLGPQGAFALDGEAELASPGFAVEAADATAAGDTFNGALAVGLTEGLGLREALRFANAAAAISVTRAGAQASIPTRGEVEDFLAARA
jgi:ribokinase